MKKLTIIICLLLTSLTNVVAQDFILLETLIDNHKTLSDKLKKRNMVEAAVAVETQQVENNSSDMKEIVKKLSNRMEGALENVQFAADVAVLTSKAIKVTQRSIEIADYALKLAPKNPEIVLEGANVVDRIGQQVNTVVKLAGMVVTNGVGVSLATNEQRMQFCMIVRDCLATMEGILYNYELYCWVSSVNNNSSERIFEILKGWNDKGSFDKTVKMLDRMKLNI